MRAPPHRKGISLGYAQPALVRYGVSLLLGGLSILLGLRFSHHWTLRLPFITIYTTLIMASAWLGGLGPGLACTGSCALSAAYFWLDPPDSFGVDAVGDLIAMTLFIGIGAVISAFSEALHRARRREERARVQREEILAIVAHDLRNPLNAISMSAALLEKDAPPGADGDPLRKRIAVLRRAAQRMNHLISDLLDWSVIEAGQLSVQRALGGMEEVRSLLSDVHEAHRDIAASKDVQIQLGMPEGDATIVFDRSRLVQMLSNLTSNALKFTPSGGRVTVRAERGDGEVRFCVSDTGPGIPAEDLPHIFERYWHKDRARGGGTGLGLYISQAIARAHGGKLEVQSKVGAGSTFSFALPIVAPENGASRAHRVGV
jgi:signal transduction histidine kinase